MEEQLCWDYSQVSPTGCSVEMPLSRWDHGFLQDYSSPQTIEMSSTGEKEYIRRWTLWHCTPWRTLTSQNLQRFPNLELATQLPTPTSVQGECHNPSSVDL